MRKWFRRNSAVFSAAGNIRQVAPRQHTAGDRLLLDYPKTAGLEGNTVVIYASDQDFCNGEHGWFDKRWIYEESVHIPLVVRWPGVVKPASRPTAMVQNIDCGPTFAEIAGGKVPEGLHGRSLVPILRGQAPADWRKSNSATSMPTQATLRP